MAIFISSAACTGTTAAGEVRLMPLGEAWAANSVNVTVFRNDPVTTCGELQYAAYYDAGGRVVIARRKLPETQWTTHVTTLTGNVKDAHNSISMIADAAGYLHLSWDHHGHPLRYARSKTAGSPDLGPLDFDVMPMTGRTEKHVTYPQFFTLPDGDLLFMYRDGGSGRGNLVVNRYDARQRQWSQLHSNLISGEDQRNAYWQACVDGRGVIHVSWVWRESGDVATNHDLCYARSDDGGRTWVKSDGAAYTLPIIESTAEIAAKIPQKHELINQTSMCAGGDGRPIIATYFRPPGEKVVQYFVIRHDGKNWQTIQATERTTAFSLSGGGSKAIPISRPQVLARTIDGKTGIWMLFRDSERDSRVSMAGCVDIEKPVWTTGDLTDFSVRYWEPSYDRVRWERDGVLNLYVQIAGQGDGETLEKVAPQTAQVLEWSPAPAK